MTGANNNSRRKPAVPSARLIRAREPFQTAVFLFPRDRIIRRRPSRASEATPVLKREISLALIFDSTIVDRRRRSNEKMREREREKREGADGFDRLSVHESIIGSLQAAQVKSYERGCTWCVMNGFKSATPP